MPKITVRCTSTVCWFLWRWLWVVFPSELFLTYTWYFLDIISKVLMKNLLQVSRKYIGFTYVKYRPSWFINDAEQVLLPGVFSWAVFISRYPLWRSCLVTVEFFRFCLFWKWAPLMQQRYLATEIWAVADRYHTNNIFSVEQWCTQSRQ